MDDENRLDLVKQGVIDRELLNYIRKYPEKKKSKFIVESFMKSHVAHDPRKELNFGIPSQFAEKNDGDVQSTSEGDIKLNCLPKELRDKIAQLITNDSGGGGDPSQETPSAFASKGIKKEYTLSSDEEMDGNESLHSSGKGSSKSGSFIASTLNKARSLTKKRKGSVHEQDRDRDELVHELKSITKNKEKLEQYLKELENEETESLNKLTKLVKTYEEIKSKKSNVAKEIQEMEERKSSIGCLLNTINSNQESEKESDSVSSDSDESSNESSDESSDSSKSSDEDKFKKELRKKSGRKTSKSTKKHVKKLRKKLDEVKDRLKTAKKNKLDNFVVKILKESRSALKKELKQANKLRKSKVATEKVSNDGLEEAVADSLVSSSDNQKAHWKNNYVNLSLNPVVQSPRNVSLSFSESLDSSIEHTSVTSSQEVSAKRQRTESPSVAHQLESDSSKRSRIESPKSFGSMTPVRETVYQSQNGEIDRFKSVSPFHSIMATESPLRRQSATQSQVDLRFHLENFNVFFGIKGKVESRHIYTIKIHKGYLYVSTKSGHLRRFPGNNGDNFVTFDGHTNGIRTFSLHKFSDALYTGCDDGLLRHFDSNNGKLIGSFHLYSVINCMEEGKTVLFIGLYNGTIVRFGFMSNKLINSYTISPKPVTALKLVAEDSEESRIIVCCESEISVHNSSTGSRFLVIDQNENSGLLATSNGLLCFISCDQSKRILLNVRHEKNQTIDYQTPLAAEVSAFEVIDDLFYIGTKGGEVVCYRLVNDRFSLHWIYMLPSFREEITSFATSGNVLLAATSDGTVVNIAMDSNGPHYCSHRPCVDKPFARVEDLERHFKVVHCADVRRGPLYSCGFSGCRRVMSTSEMYSHFVQKHCA